MEDYEELLPFYGPLQHVHPSDKVLIPPAFVQEIEGWKPVVGEDVDHEGRIITSDKFSDACKSIFGQSRFYLNMRQLEQAAHRLVGLWGKKSSESKQRAVRLSSNKQTTQMTIQCGFIRWKIHVVPVKGRGKGAAYRIMSGLDLNEPGLDVIKIKESKLENRGSNPLYFQAHPRTKPGDPIKQEEDLDSAAKGKASPRSVTARRKEDEDSDDEFFDAVTGEGNNKGGDSSAQTSSNSPARAPKKLKSPTDIEIVSSDGISFFTHKAMLAAASPTLKAIIIAMREEGKEKDPINMTSPAQLVRAALTAIYRTEPLDADLADNHMKECISFASEYGLVKFQKVVHRALLSRLNVGNLLRALLEAHKTQDETFKQGCFEFVQKHARQVLKSRRIVRLATEEPDFWDELVEASFGIENSADEDATERVIRREQCSGSLEALPSRVAVTLIKRELAANEEEVNSKRSQAEAGGPSSDGTERCKKRQR